MEWLKDKKNLPIVAALLAVVVLGAAGFVVFNLGLIPGFGAAPTPPPVVVTPGARGPGGPPVGTGLSGPPRGIPGGPPSGFPPGRPSPLPAGRTAAVPPVVKPASTNPKVGPDPFSLPNSAQKLTQIRRDSLPVKLPIRDLVGPLNLFRIRPPAPPPSPILPPVADGAGPQPTTGGGGSNPAGDKRLSGIVNGPDGINAIIETGGQSQEAKPGDTLPDGTRVQNIQATSVTLKSTGGTVFTLSLSAGTPDQGPGNPNGFGGPPQFGQPNGFNGTPGGFNGQQQINQ